MCRNLWLRLKTGKNPRFYFGKGETSLKQAAGLNPKDIYIHLTNARLKWRKAEWKISRGLSAAQDLKEGLSFLENALSINPNFAETYALKGVLLQLLSKIEKNKTLRLTAGKEAKDSLLKGIKINGNLKTLFSRFLGKKR